MVGGDVIGIVRTPESTLLNVRDRTYGDRCALRVREQRRDNGAPVTIALGDAIWWQGDDAMWTPQAMRHTDPGTGCGVTWDIHLPRIGFAH